MDLVECVLYLNSLTLVRSGFPLHSKIIKYNKIVLILNLSLHYSDCLILQAALSF